MPLSGYYRAKRSGADVGHTPEKFHSVARGAAHGFRQGVREGTVRFDENLGNRGAAKAMRKKMTESSEAFDKKRDEEFRAKTKK